MNILEYYLNKLDKNSTSSKSLNITQLKMTENSNNKNKTNKIFVTYLSVFYSSEDSLNCCQSPRNTSLYACSDKLLEAKLKAKLTYLYSIQIQPLNILKQKINCLNSETNSDMTCKFTTKRVTSRKKLKWKVLLITKAPTLEPRSNLFSHDQNPHEYNKQIENVNLNSHLSNERTKSNNFLSVLINNFIFMHFIKK